jgi:hypothetical protein
MSPSRLTHCNGRAVAEVLRTRARVCVFYVEEDANGQLSRRPFWGNAHDYDPSRGLQVWFDGMGELEWVDEGDDWTWETTERSAALCGGATQRKLPFQPVFDSVPDPDAARAPAPAAPPTLPPAPAAPSTLPPAMRSLMAMAARGNDSPHTAATFKFHKKAKLFRSARAKGVPEDSLPLLKHRFVKGALAGWGAPPRPSAALPYHRSENLAALATAARGAVAKAAEAKPPAPQRAAAKPAGGGGAPAAAPAPFPLRVAIESGDSGAAMSGAKRKSPDASAPASAAAVMRPQPPAKRLSPTAADGGARPLANWNQVVVL